jgi:hypothetical protein
LLAPILDQSSHIAELNFDRCTHKSCAREILRISNHANIRSEHWTSSGDAVPHERSPTNPEPILVANALTHQRAKFFDLLAFTDIMDSGLAGKSNGSKKSLQGTQKILRTKRWVNANVLTVTQSNDTAV